MTREELEEISKGGISAYWRWLQQRLPDVLDEEPPPFIVSPELYRQLTSKEP